MTAVCFFLTVFFGIFGAYIFIGHIYERTTDSLKKRKIKNARNTGRTAHDKRDSRRDNI